MSIIRNAAWLLAGRWVHNAINLLSFAVIARHISADSYGVFVIASIFIIFSELFFADIIESTVIRGGSSDSLPDTTMFWLSSAIGAAFGLALAAIGPALSRLYDIGDLSLAMLGVSLVVVLQSSSCVGRALMLRRSMVRQHAMNAGISNFAAASVAVVFAMNGAGYWSLIAQYSVMHLLSAILAHFSTRFVPSLSFCKQHARRHAKFIKHGFYSTVVSVFSQRLDVILLGLSASPAQVGLFGLAKRIVQIAQDLIANSFDKALLLLKAENVGKDGGKDYTKTVLAQSIVLAPAFTGLALTANVLVPLLFGREWAASGLLVTLMAAGAAFYALGRVERAELIFEGRSKEILLARIAETGIAVLLLVPVMKQGPAVFALMYSVRSACAYLVIFYTRCKAADIPVVKSFWRQLWTVRAPLVSSTAMAATAILLSQFLETLSATLRLGFVIATSGGVYLLCMLLLRGQWLTVLRTGEMR